MCTSSPTALWTPGLPVPQQHCTCQVLQASLLVSRALLSGPTVPPLTENDPLVLYHFHLLENLPQKHLILLALNEVCEQFGIFLCNKK